MASEVITLVVWNRKTGKTEDVEVPANITANDLVTALNNAYQLGIHTENIQECYLKADNPTVLLRGNRTLADFGLYDGSVVYING
jgi:uncharacterized ubiquitin-like protein YukD